MVGLFGGTFDPVHEGHLLLARVALARYPFKRIYLVPARQNPLKQNHPAVPPEARVEMLKRAVAETGESRLEVIDWEALSPQPSYTLNTLERVIQKNGPSVAILMGNEVFRDLPRWHEPQKLVRLADFIVVLREGGLGFDPGTVLDKIGVQDATPSERKSRVRYLGGTRWVDRLDMVTLPLSATQMREQLAAHWKSSDWRNPPQGIQRSVWQYIKENRLYTVS